MTVQCRVRTLAVHAVVSIASTHKSFFLGMIFFGNDNNAKFESTFPSSYFGRFNKPSRKPTIISATFLLPSHGALQITTYYSSAAEELNDKITSTCKKTSKN